MLKIVIIILVILLRAPEIWFRPRPRNLRTGPGGPKAYTNRVVFKSTRIPDTNLGHECIHTNMSIDLRRTAGLFLSNLRLVERPFEPSRTRVGRRSREKIQDRGISAQKSFPEEEAASTAFDLAISLLLARHRVAVVCSQTVLSSAGVCVQCTVRVHCTIHRVVYVYTCRTATYCERRRIALLTLVFPFDGNVDLPLVGRGRLYFGWIKL
jgi:hypothetical protein